MLLVKNWGVVVDVVYRERLLFGSEQLFGACAFITEVQVCFKRTSVEMIHVKDHAKARWFLPALNLRFLSKPLLPRKLFHLCCGLIKLRYGLMLLLLRPLLRFSTSQDVKR